MDGLWTRVSVTTTLSSAVKAPPRADLQQASPLTSTLHVLLKRTLFVINYYVVLIVQSGSIVPMTILLKAASRRPLVRREPTIHIYM